MLGKGRPFVLEITNARAAMPTLQFFEKLQAELNAVRLAVILLGCYKPLQLPGQKPAVL